MVSISSRMYLPGPLPAAASAIDRILLQQSAGDHQPLQLVGASADYEQWSVTVVSLNGKVFCIAVPAKDPHRLQRTLLGGLGREQLCHPGFQVAPLSAIFLFRRRIN